MAWTIISIFPFDLGRIWPERNNKVRAQHVKKKHKAPDSNWTLSACLFRQPAERKWCWCRYDSSVYLECVVHGREG